MKASRNPWSRLAAIAASVLLTVGLAACASSATSPESASPAAKIHVPIILPGAAQPPGGKPVSNLTWAVSSNPVSMDPAYAYDYVSTPIVAQMCEGLLQFNEATGQLEPALATSWSEVNPTTYVYNIRHGVTFWNGTPLTAADVQFSLERYASPTVAAYASSYYEDLKSIDITGSYQVTVHLTKPFAQWKYVPALISAGAIISKAYALKEGKNLGTPSGGIMCTGPFKFVSWTNNQSVVLVRNDNWWNKAHLPKVQKITFVVVPDEETLIAGLNNGSIDGTLYQFDGREASQLSGPVRLFEDPSSNYFALYFNTQRKPWNDPRVRQAFAYAIDYAGIRDAVYNNLGQTIDSVVPPVLWTFDKPAFEKAYAALPNYTTTNLAKARRLIAEAGAKGASGTLMIQSASTDSDTALIILQAANELGIKLSVSQVPFAQKTAIEYNDGAKSYDLDLLAWLSDTPEPLGILNPEFNSVNVSSDVSAYSNPQVNEYLNDAESATSPDAEAQYIIKAQAIIMQQVPEVPYLASDSLVPINKSLTGFTSSFFSYWNDWAAYLSGTK
jgi:peptide/nickel transport system substrate-binding protein